VTNKIDSDVRLCIRYAKLLTDGGRDHFRTYCKKQRNSRKINNYGWIISANYCQRRKLFILESCYTPGGQRPVQQTGLKAVQEVYVVSEGQ
jgi:hypothetical protein